MHAKNALVTGGLQGIGHAIVQKLLVRGDTVFVFDCVAPTDQKVQALVQQGVIYFQVDVSSTESIMQGFSKIPDTLDVLINNAGITRDTLAVRMSEKDWDSVLDVNVKGAFFCIQHALKRMIKQQGGYIINISSIVGLTGNPGQINYAASKAALIGVTKTVALEYAGRNILANAIAPGFIKTPMTDGLSNEVKQNILDKIPLKRFGAPDDVANLVQFLTSGMADYITGQVFTVSGGM